MSHMFMLLGVIPLWSECLNFNAEFGVVERQMSSQNRNGQQLNLRRNLRNEMRPS